MKESSEKMAVVMSIPVNDSTSSPCSSPSKVPRRLRRRLSECRTPATAEEIDAKLKDADLRRQQFHEFLSSKARPKQRSPSWSSSQELDPGQKLEAKLNAAEQKRLSILANAQMRLARLGELRQAAKSEVEMRVEKERGELGMKVESRVQQAEANRMRILRSRRQRRAARKERTSQSLMRRSIQESKYKECVRAAIYQKRVAAERKRLGLLEAERSKAHARLMRVQRAANFVYNQREMERIKKREQLEDRLQRARRQRAELLKQKKSINGSSHVNGNDMHDQASHLARKLSRCWRQFVNSRGTTHSLVKAFEGLNINEKSVKSMPFEQLAVLIESDATLKIVKSLVDRLEVYLRAWQGTSGSSGLENIDHLLKRVPSPKRRRNGSHTSRIRGQKRAVSGEEGTQTRRILSRYPVRIVLCAYMILGHPDAVLSGKGGHEAALAEAAVKFIQEFQLLITIILEGGGVKSASGDNHATFRSQLKTFDKAWCSYLYCFVVWKVKDAKLLEEDLVRAACQMELSMMHTCKLTPEGGNRGLTHDMKAIQKQVIEDQALLKAKVQDLSGEAGIERMENAIADARSQFFALKESGSPFASPVAHISSSGHAHVSSPGQSSSSDTSPSRVSGGASGMVPGSERLSSVARSLFKEDDTRSQAVLSSPLKAHHADGKSSINLMPVTENELVTKIKETMEKAFWDGIMESMKQEQPDFNWVLKLMTEIRDELCDLSPGNWQQEIIDTIDIDILSQVLKSGTLDLNYLGKLLEYALMTLQKLSAPVNDDEMKAAHLNLVKELSEVSQCGHNTNSSLATAVIKGLRFVLTEIQNLKREISKARIGMIEPMIKGPAGFDYLQKAFVNRYGPASDASNSLPLTKSWLTTVSADVEREWDEHLDSLLTLPDSEATSAQGIPSTTLRTGGGVSVTSRTCSLELTSTGKEQPECKGERMDLFLRVGLLKLVSEIEGLVQEGLPETLKLNVSRLRVVQSQLQKIIVISTSMLVLRQALLSEQLVTNPSDVENIISQSAKQLSELLDKAEDIGIKEIVESIIGLSDDLSHIVNLEKLRSRMEVVANMLSKSLKSGDAIFTHVSRAIHLAVRAAVLGGTSTKGRQLVEIALRRVGAPFLTDKVIDIAEVLIVVATVSTSVHGPWYEQLLKNM
ncbi:T-complex protein 11-like protein [Bienertia sinuspersici]